LEICGRRLKSAIRGESGGRPRNAQGGRSGRNTLSIRWAPIDRQPFPGLCVKTHEVAGVNDDRDERIKKRLANKVEKKRKRWGATADDCKGVNQKRIAVSHSPVANKGKERGTNPKTHTINLSGATIGAGRRHPSWEGIKRLNSVEGRKQRKLYKKRLSSPRELKDAHPDVTEKAE